MVPGIFRRFRWYYLPTRVKISSVIEAEALCYRYYPQYVNPEDTVVEVGVYLGGGTRLLSKLANRVYSFEPHPLHYKVAKVLLSKGIVSNVTLYNFALGNVDGLAELRVKSERGNDIAASTVGVTGNTYDSSIRVKMRRLDSLSIAPDVLIMDAEGAELAVLEGGSQSLQKLKAAIIETHPIASGHTLPAVRVWAENHFSQVKVIDVEGNIPWVMAKQSSGSTSQ